MHNKQQNKKETKYLRSKLIWHIPNNNNNNSESFVFFSQNQNLILNGYRIQ